MVSAAKKSGAVTKARKTRQSSPVRLAEKFYKRMDAVARVNSRSIPKQLEHMVNIAESVVDHVSREELLEVQSGLSKIVVEKIDAPRVDKAVLFDSIERKRKSGTLSVSVTQAEARYQASELHPGYLERINDDGSRDIGMFSGGKFKVAKELA